MNNKNEGEKNYSGKSAYDLLQTTSGSWWWGCMWVGRETSVRHLPHPTFRVSVNLGPVGEAGKQRERMVGRRG